MSVREQLVTVTSCEPSKRIGGDGKEYTVKPRKPAPAPEAEQLQTVCSSAPEPEQLAESASSTC